MKKVLFHDHWYYAPQSFEFLGTPTESFRPVTPPHDALIHENRQAHMPGGRNTGYFPYGSYEYKKTFDYREEWRGKKVQILFEGVYAVAKVYVNHMYAGGCMNGYTPFLLDIHPFLHEGTNEISVICRIYRDSRWYSGAGIYRDVYLLVSDPVHIPYGKSSVTTKEIRDGEAVLEANILLKNDTQETHSGKVRITVFDKRDQIAAQCVRTITLFPGEEKNCRQRIVISDPDLWSTDTPDLYRLEAALQDISYENDDSTKCADNMVEQSAGIRDTEQIVFGIRRLSLSKTRGLEINGRTVRLRGTCIHHDNGIVGSCAYHTLAFRRIRLLKEAGINAVRISHHPAGSDILDACDRLGMLVMNEVADAWTVCKNPYDYALYFDGEWEKTVRSMVESSRNHPSVILYSLGNEIIECGNPRGAQVAWQLNEKIKELDQDRYTILSLNVLLCMMDLKPSQEPQEEEGSKDVNEAMTKGQHVFKSLITSSAVAQKVEEAMGYVDIVGYNYGDSRYLIDQVEYPDRILCGSETFSEDLADNWQLVKENPQVIGDFNWTGWDYIGETGIGMMEYPAMEGQSEKQENSLWKLAFCGDFDLNGNRRAQSYYREAVWGEAKHPWIVVQHPDHFGREPERTPWSFFDGIPCWDFPGAEGRMLAVQVYSDGDEVELWLNGKSLGRKMAGEKAGFCTTFELIYEPGELCAKAFRGGEECSAWSVKSGKGKSKITITREDGIDQTVCEQEKIHYYRIENVYENGVIDAWSDPRIKISVENGQLLGFGSADPKGIDAFDAAECSLYQGRAAAIVRGDDEVRVRILDVIYNAKDE